MLAARFAAGAFLVSGISVGVNNMMLVQTEPSSLEIIRALEQPRAPDVKPPEQEKKPGPAIVAALTP